LFLCYPVWLFVGAEPAATTSSHEHWAITGTVLHEQLLRSEWNGC